VAVKDVRFFDIFRFFLSISCLIWEADWDISVFFFSMFVQYEIDTLQRSFGFSFTSSEASILQRHHS
jgi:hypothetical protein